VANTKRVRRPIRAAVSAVVLVLAVTHLIRQAEIAAGCVRRVRHGTERKRFGAAATLQL
jgi:hypothetical protein